MTYLLQHTRLPGSVGLRTRTARVDEYVRLNRPGLYGDAFVRVYVGDTSTRRRGRREPRLVLQIADCVNVINLEFSLYSEERRENALFKVDTLIGALNRFRDGVAAEAELAAGRERHRH